MKHECGTGLVPRGAPVAVKMFESMQLSQVQDQTMHELRKEAQMMEKLSNHPHIVKFVGAITKGTKLYARGSDCGAHRSSVSIGVPTQRAAMQNRSPW
jgi:hypothetical protein